MHDVRNSSAADFERHEGQFGHSIFHVTHWKAGSQWIHRILQATAADHIVQPRDHQTQFLETPLAAGRVYPTVYVTREQFESVALPPGSKTFVVIRDLRDTLISGYFSIRLSHPLTAPAMVDWRTRLRERTIDDGLMLLMDEWLGHSADIQRSWLGTTLPLVRYEDLLVNDVALLEPLLIDHCGLPVERAVLRRVIEQHRFEQLTGGRVRGQEDVTKHERKGIAGDWLNYITSRIAREFDARFGDVLIATGYESSRDWVFGLGRDRRPSSGSAA